MHYVVESIEKHLNGCSLSPGLRMQTHSFIFLCSNTASNANFQLHRYHHCLHNSVYNDCCSEYFHCCCCVESCWNQANHDRPEVA